MLPISQTGCFTFTVMSVSETNEKKFEPDPTLEAVESTLSSISLAMSNGNFEEAKTLLTEAIAHSPTDLFASEYVEWLFTVLILKKDWNEAIEILTKMVDFPEESFYRQMLCLQLIKNDKWDEAEVICRNSIKKKPQEVFCYQMIGLVLMKNNRWDETETIYRKAIELDPTDTTNHTALAAVLLQKNKLDEAKEIISNGIELGSKTINYSDFPKHSYLQAQALYTAAEVLELMPTFLDP